MSGTGPLSGLTIIDLTRVLAGPYCTMVLSDLGARVIKVERPGRGDDARSIGPFIDGESAYFMSLNRGKESIALDLKDPEDLAHFERMLSGADVLVENFRPGVLARLGLGWEVLSKRYPRLVVASTSGFGQTGPYSNRPAYDVVVQGMGGLMSLTGEPGGGPTRVGTSIGDIAAGLFTVIGIQSALIERARTGRGQYIDVAMLDCQVALLENAIARYQATGTAPGPIGSRHPSITPFAAFLASDGHLIIAAGNNSLFRRLCDAIDAPDLSTDPRFATNESRCEHHDALREAIEAALASRTVDEWIRVLQDAGLPCGPINDVAEVLGDVQVRARNMVVPVDGGPSGKAPGEGFSVAGNPIKLSNHEDPESRGAVPALDADRAGILGEGAK